MYKILAKSVICSLSIFCISLIMSSAANAQLLRNTCKPHKHCTSAAKPCEIKLGFGDRVFIVGSDAAGAASLGVAAFRVRLCTGVSDTCSGGEDDQALQVFLGDLAGGIAFQTNLFINKDGSVLDTGGHTEIGPHTYMAVQCTNNRCHFAAQHCRKQLPFIMPSP